jgi:hypothetical protein
MKPNLVVFIGAILIGYNHLAAQIPYPGENPGQANIKILSVSRIILENNVVRMEFVNDGVKIKIAGFEDKKSGNKVQSNPLPLFEIMLQDSSLMTSDDFMLVNSPVSENITGNEYASCFAERLPGKKYSAELQNKKEGLSVHWEADLRDGSNYVRQIFNFKANDGNKILKMSLVKLPVHIGARKEGTVDGIPIVYDNMFFAIEYPLSKVEEDKTSISAFLPRLMNEVSTVWGITPENQLRRGFLYYVERERAHPYHQVLHYNSWFDIAWDERKYTERECMDRIKVFGDSLIKKRHAPLKGFLFDDGWDDNKTLWQFHSGFPHGFSKLKEVAELYNSYIGVWLSPFGGYGDAKRLRIEYGNRQNPPFETNDQGFSLSGPVYYNRFKEVTTDFIKRYDISMFKFDGIGGGSGAGISYQKDIEAFLKLLDELLALKSNLYLSLTTGTWPSVYWLKYGDNIWRGGDDTNMMGEGSKRQQWITYRDAETYKNVVERSPLFPLNALMLCGICIADNGNPGSFEMIDRDISDEIWSFFATGTNLQELYINPHKLNTDNWNCLADASNWAKENESVMADVHWVGGDPSKGEVYGFAAWSMKKAVLSFRNPSKVEKTFEVIVTKVFDLPDNLSDSYAFYEVRKMKETGHKQISLQGRTFRITLLPFEIKVFDAFPAN